MGHVYIVVGFYVAWEALRVRQWGIAYDESWKKKKKKKPKPESKHAMQCFGTVP